MSNLWCEIDLAAMAANIDKIRDSTNKGIIAVVKCNAYGLGIEKITSFLDDKVDGFAVADIDEALKVKSRKPVLILCPEISHEDIRKVKDNFIITVDNTIMLEKLTGKPCTVHILVDTGMNRFGINYNNVDKLITKIINEYPNIKVDGIYTHLNHTRNAKYTNKQIRMFKNVVKNYPFIRNVHVYNSAGFLKYNSGDGGFGNCIRVGNLIYGNLANEDGYKKVYSYKTRALSVYDVEKNCYIGYGNKYKTKKRIRVGVLDVGFVHGFNCSKNIKSGLFYSLARTMYHRFRKKSLVYCKGKPVEILGSGMNYTIVKLDNVQADKNSVFEIEMSSILADATIAKKYFNANNLTSSRDIRIVI